MTSRREAKRDSIRRIFFHVIWMIKRAAFEVTGRSELVDFFLGMKDSVALKSMRVVEHRFGIGEPIAPINSGPGTLSITDHPTIEGAVLIRRDAFSPAIEFPARWYFPPPALNLPEDEFKVRLVAPTFEMLLWPHVERLRFQSNFDPQASYALEQIRDHAVAMSLLAQSEQAPCRIEFMLGGEAAYTGTAKVATGEDWSKVATAANAALALMRRAGIATSDKARLAELMHARHLLEALDGFASGAPAKVEVEDLSCHEPSQPTGFIKTLCVTFGSFDFWTVLAVIGKTTVHDGVVSLKSRNARSIRVFARPRSDECNQQMEAELIKIASDILKAEGIRPIAA